MRVNISYKSYGKVA